jgi:site-specific recombinase XerD
MLKKHQLEELCDRYLSEKNISAATIKSYGFAFKHYINYLKAHDIEYATVADVINFRENQRSRGHSNVWIYIQISALKGLYQYLKQNQKRLNLSKKYAYDITEPIKNQRLKASVKKPILTIEQAKQMILRTREKRLHIWDFRDYAIIYLMITSGLARFDIVHAKRSDLKMVEGKPVLYIKRGKKQKADPVMIAKGAKQAIDEYLKKRKDKNPYLFVTNKNPSPNMALSRMFFRRMFKRVLKNCGLEKTSITPHCLRHTAATLNLLRGGTVEGTKHLMRHISIDSTLVYVNYLNRLKDASESQIEKFILGEEISEFLEL